VPAAATMRARRSTAKRHLAIDVLGLLVTAASVQDRDAAKPLLWNLRRAVLPRRWVVERTRSWVTRHRRTVRDYERLAAHHETYVYWATIVPDSEAGLRSPGGRAEVSYRDATGPHSVGV